MYTKVCSKMKESVSSAFYMGTLKCRGIYESIMRNIGRKEARSR